MLSFFLHARPVSLFYGCCEASLHPLSCIGSHSFSLLLQGEALVGPILRLSGSDIDTWAVSSSGAIGGGTSTPTSVGGGAPTLHLCVCVCLRRVGTVKFERLCMLVRKGLCTLGFELALFCVCLCVWIVCWPRGLFVLVSGLLSSIMCTY